MAKFKKLSLKPIEVTASSEAYIEVQIDVSKSGVFSCDVPKLHEVAMMEGYAFKNGTKVGSSGLRFTNALFDNLSKDLFELHNLVTQSEVTVSTVILYEFKHNGNYLKDSKIPCVDSSEGELVLGSGNWNYCETSGHSVQVNACVYLKTTSSFNCVSRSKYKKMTKNHDLYVNQMEGLIYFDLVGSFGSLSKDVNEISYNDEACIFFKTMLVAMVDLAAKLATLNDKTTLLSAIYNEQNLIGGNDEGI